MAVFCPWALVYAIEDTDVDLASFEGKHPKDLFNKSGVANGQAIGHVIEEMGDNIVVFGDSEDSRFDVTRSKVYLSGGSVVVNDSLDQME